MTYHRLYVGFDKDGEPVAVSPIKDELVFPDGQVREFASEEVADSLADKQVDLMVKVMDLQDCIRELLKGGEHEGECDNDQGMLNEGGACQKHCAINEQREAAARKLLEETNG